MNNKHVTEFVGGTIGVFMNLCFGEWSPIMTCLLSLCVCDIITGILLAGVFHESKYSNGISSSGLYAGAARKCMYLVMLVVGRQMDIVFNLDFVKSSVATYLTITEFISVVENLTRMGVPVPAFVKRLLNNQLDTFNKEDKHRGT